MTPERAKVLLAWVPYLEAMADGKQIQCRENEKWRNCRPIMAEDLLQPGGPYFSPADWRIKPEPREFWVIRWTTGAVTIRDDQPVHVCPAGAGTTVKEIIHVREVLPE